MSPGGLVGRLVRLAALGTLAAWLVDRRLGDRRADRGPRPIRTAVTVAAPIERVWAVLADIERQPEWMHDLKSVRLTTPGPTGVGTRGVGRVQVFGIAVEDPVVVTAFEVPSHFAIRHEGLVTGGGDIRLAETADGETTVTWDETLVAPLFPHLGEVVLSMVFRPVFQRDLDRLAAMVEAV
jgi:uncharacterized protein YndB with AHSA1/START domain